LPRAPHGRIIEACREKPRRRPLMFAKLNHLAIVSENFALSSRFYEAYFGMKQAKGYRAEGAAVVGDGYVGMNVNPRVPGRGGRLEHFGFEVTDAQKALDRLKEFPGVDWLKRPSNRPYAGISAHDPDGNVFDISQQEMENRTDVYAEQSGSEIHPRHISHFGLRTMHPDAMADFYRRVFELEPRNKQPGDPNHYLTDGHMTLVIIPWKIKDYDATGIMPPSLDHMGFKVESLEKFKADIERIKSRNPYLAPFPIDYGPEMKARTALFAKSCPLCQFHFSDFEGVLLGASEA
jgi:catechol 2,3-dioxygenase-like lactoylglutathione lyase family enzyme